MDEVNRRRFMQVAGPASLIPALPGVAFAQAAAGPKIIEEVVPLSPDAEAKPKYSIKFAVPPLPPSTPACARSIGPGGSGVKSNLTVTAIGVTSSDGAGICVSTP